MCEVADIVVLMLLILCSISDVKKRGVYTWILVAMSMLLLVFCFWGGEERIVRALMGTIVGCFFLLVSWVTKEEIGYADSWLILLLGGYLGIRGVLVLLTLAFLISGIYGLVGFAIRRLKRESTVPFIPFLTIGFVGVIFL